MKLSDRLLLMAQNINQGETMADIGTDHGFLALYLVEKGICNKTILADISQGSLEKARRNVEEFRRYMPDVAPEGTFDLRLGNGIDILAPGEVEVVCIAGMGGALIADILNDDIEKAKTFKRFILQPRNGQIQLRKWLYENHFTIEKNLLVPEGKFICEIIIAVPSPEQDSKDQPKPSDFEFEFPPDLFLHNPELATKFAEKKLQGDLMILDWIGERDPKRAQEIAAHAHYLKELLHERRHS